MQFLKAADAVAATVRNVRNEDYTRGETTFIQVLWLKAELRLVQGSPVVGFLPLTPVIPIL